MDCKLIKIQKFDKKHLEEIYKWTKNEKNSELFTCRPVKKYYEFDTYYDNIIRIINKNIWLYGFFIDNKLIGKIFYFDYNKRNRSVEFGYYLPEINRKKGYGSIMIEKFLKELFLDDKLGINKIYATTGSFNKASIKLLEKSNFILDGKLREHYWIGDAKYDQCIYSLLRKEYFERR